MLFFRAITAGMLHIVEEGTFRVVSMRKKTAGTEPAALLGSV
jgi:hypothetical protein